MARRSPGGGPRRPSFIYTVLYRGRDQAESDPRRGRSDGAGLVVACKDVRTACDPHLSEPAVTGVEGVLAASEFEPVSVWRLRGRHEPLSRRRVGARSGVRIRFSSRTNLCFHDLLFLRSCYLVACSGRANNGQPRLLRGLVYTSFCWGTSIKHCSARTQNALVPSERQAKAWPQARGERLEETECGCTNAESQRG